MTTLELVIGILLLVMALFLIVSILMQSGKSKKLSGTIAGGAETFFGKEKGKAINQTLSRVTNLVSVVFVVLVLALLLINTKDTADKEAAKDNSSITSTDTSSKVEASGDSASKEEASKDTASKEEASKAESSEAASAEASEAASAESSEASVA